MIASWSGWRRNSFLSSTVMLSWADVAWKGIWVFAVATFWWLESENSGKTKVMKWRQGGTKQCVKFCSFGFVFVFCANGYMLLTWDDFYWKIVQRIVAFFRFLLQFLFNSMACRLLSRINRNLRISWSAFLNDFLHHIEVWEKCIRNYSIRINETTNWRTDLRFGFMYCAIFYYIMYDMPFLLSSKFYFNSEKV